VCSCAKAARISVGHVPVPAVAVTAVVAPAVPVAAVMPTAVVSPAVPVTAVVAPAVVAPAVAVTAVPMTVVTTVGSPTVPVAYPCQNPINQLHLTHLIHLKSVYFLPTPGRI